jgi:predicted PP-loop superfamily ATPase
MNCIKQSSYSPRLEARLNSGDADFYRADIDGLRAATSGMGGQDSARRR